MFVSWGVMSCPLCRRDETLESLRANTRDLEYRYRPTRYHTRYNGTSRCELPAMWAMGREPGRGGSRTSQNVSPSHSRELESAS